MIHHSLQSGLMLRLLSDNLFSLWEWWCNDKVCRRNINWYFYCQLKTSALPVTHQLQKSLLYFLRSIFEKNSWIFQSSENYYCMLWTSQYLLNSLSINTSKALVGLLLNLIMVYSRKTFKRCFYIEQYQLCCRPYRHLLSWMFKVMNSNLESCDLPK